MEYKIEDVLEVDELEGIEERGALEAIRPVSGRPEKHAAPPRPQSPARSGVYETRDYIERRKKLSGFLFETALPNEYLVEVGVRDVKPTLGGRRFSLFKRFLRVPASVQTLTFVTDNANVDYQGIGIEGYASWRIDPEHPEVAIKTLDFFDPNDPMARTNSELVKICVEAVRHVISNMGIDDALKKKDEIAEDLLRQLREIERKWGILFDQVGIEKVRIMSDRLFEQLQAQYRDGLRLEVERKRMATDREIATEKNAMRERSGLETLETDRRLELGRVERESQVKAAALTERAKLARQQLEVDQATFRDEQAFKTEKERRQHDLAVLEKTLQAELALREVELLTREREVEELRAGIGERQLGLERLRREVAQVFSSGALSRAFIDKLPELYSSLRIDNYTVLDSGGGQVSPVTKLVSELAATFKGLDLKGIFGGDKPKEG